MGKEKGMCKLLCTEGEDYCCICCQKRSECRWQCDDLDDYEYTEDCPNYVKEKKRNR